MVFLALQIPCPQSGKLTLVLKKTVKVSSDNHVQIDVKLFALNARIEECDFAPPSFPPLFKGLDFYIFVKTSWVLSETIKGDLPSCVSLDSRIQFIYVVSRVPCAPFYAQYIDLLLFFVLLFWHFPGINLNRLKALVVGVNFLLSILDY